MPQAVKPSPIALLIDDDKANRRLLRVMLESRDYRVVEAKNGRFGLTAARACQPDVIILELSLPGIGGLCVLKRLRLSSQTPVLVLSANVAEADIVTALDEGANDYMTKPFNEAELLARLRVLRRCIRSELDEPTLIEGDLKVDLTKHLVTLSGCKIDLTRTEEALFHMLVAYAGKVVSGNYLLRSVWGAEGEHQGACLRVFISNLRRKLEWTRGRIVIENAGSLGYRLFVRGAGHFTESLSFG
jgi:two-component system KDP operon response regulator KdpE